MTVASRVLAGMGAAFRRRAGDLLDPIVGALTSQHDEVDRLLGTGDRPWQPAFDLDTTPIPAWLGSITGTPVPGGLSLDAQRAYVRDRPAARRGTPRAMRAAVRATLRGSQRVNLVERDGGDAYALRVQVYAAEVLDAAATEQAARSQKPVGLVLTVETLTGATYAHMRDLHGPSYADFTARYPTYADARDHVPE